jgi:N-methylhydantoinase B
MEMHAAPQPKAQVDPITLEVVRNSLIATVKEMTDNLVRTAYSPIAAEIKDFSVGLLDIAGDSIMQAPYAAPAFIADLDVTIRAGLELLGVDGFEPGDVVLCNDAETNGQHLNNMAAYSPIFAGSELLGFSAVRSHWIDVGGKISGSMSVDARDIQAEGFQLPTMKVYRAGKPDLEIHRFIERNSRFPELVLGDMRAQISACRLGERRTLELIGKYGKDTVRACIERIWDENELIARRAVEAIPDGVYEASCRLDNDGITLDQPIPLRVKVIVAGSDMTVDFTGTSPQVQGPYNSKSAEAVARIAFKFFTTPDLPANVGAFRNLKVICPEGTVLSASGRAPMAWWNMPVNSSIDLILRALYGAIPEGVTAGHADNIGQAQLAGVNPRTGKPFQTFLPYAGSWGATARSDGESAIVSLIQGDVRLLPVELRENMFPLRIREFSLRADSGGPGKFRGGLGVHIEQQALADCSYQAQYERTLDAPWGLAGGQPGEITRTWRERPGSGERSALPMKCNDLAFKAGDTEVLLTAGSGGYGSPIERDPDLVRNDVLNGYVSAESARRDYGVVIGEASLAVDVPATQALRAERLDSSKNR